MVDQSLNVIPQIKGGTIKVYAIAAPARLESLPDVPTTKELGVDFIFSAWNAMVAPKGTPKEIVDKLVDALSKALDDATDQGALRRARQHGPAGRRSRPGRPAEAGRERDGAHHAGAQGGHGRGRAGREEVTPVGSRGGAMRLTDEEQAMLAGEQGPVRQWAIRHQIAVGEFFDAPDFVPVGQAHIMADTESLGEAGVAWLEGLAAAAAGASAACASPPSPTRAASTSPPTSA